MHSLFMLVKLYLFKQEKTLESLTDLKEITPVNSKKKVSATKAEAPILWPPDVKN